MKKIILLFLLFPVISNAQSFYKYVNPFIGTGGHGHTFPGATAPFGFCQLSPDTRIDGSWDGCGGYHYLDSIIYGFSHTHLSGTGVSDYGDILLMPVTKEMNLDNYQYKSSFGHQNESAVAGYYQVFLNEPKVNVELTAHRHSGFHKYTYAGNDNTFVVLDLAHRDEVLHSKMVQIDNYTIRGYRFSKAWATNQKVFFEIQFEQEIENIVYEPLPGGSNTTAIDLTNSRRALIQLKARPKKQLGSSGQSLAEPNVIKIKVGISGVDEEGAHKNLEKEIPHWDFDKTKKWVQNEWNKELGKIIVAEDRGEKAAMMHPDLYGDSLLNHYQNTNNEKQIIFYTALYHCMVAPNIYSDVDHRYRGRDDKIYSTNGEFDYYTVFSLWDTYRALHPLLTIIDKKRTNDFIKTFIKQYEQGGRLPVWELSSNETNCMIGYHAVSVIWDAYNKGIRNYDAEKAFEAMKSIATEDSEALKSYMRYGYVRAEDDAESVSKTVEYAYNDWCIAQMAKALGKEEDYKIFDKRSHNWMNVYDPTTGFMRARKNATLMEPFSPYLVDNNYTEANSWQYSFYVPHHYLFFKELLGGNQALEKKLDALFSAKEETEGRTQSDITGLIGQYAHGNEPSHHIPYLYHLIGKPEKGNKILSRIMNEFYTNAPDGYIGNEDCGQMSAWYVLNALDIYSFCPGEIDYVLFGGMSELETSSDYLKNDGGYLAIVKTVDSADNIKSTDSTAFWRNDEISEYPEMSFEKFVSSPFIINGKRVFENEQVIELRSNGKKGVIYYTLNNGSQWNEYQQPITINSNQTILFKSVINDNGESISSPIQTASFTKLPSDKKVFLKSKYTSTYHAGGPMGLVDGIYGTTNWRAGEWQGFQGQDFEAVVKYTGDKKITNLSINFLQDRRPWIFMPNKVQFFVSQDSVKWDLISEIAIAQQNGPDDRVFTEKYQSENEIKYNHLKGRPVYFKFVAKNFGALPMWHPGAGNPAYIFVDEIELY